jgi:hypothetical protein
MTLYGDLIEVTKMLRSHESIVQGADLTSQIEKIQRVVSLLIDEKTGRTFGVAPVETSRIVWAGPSKYLLLDPPARTITSVETGGTWNGIDLVSPTALAAEYFAYDPVDDAGLIWGLRVGLGMAWGFADIWGMNSTPVRVTGIWGDASSSAAVPDDIEYIANYLIAASYRRSRTSAEAQIGPDGSVTAVPDPWKDETVKAVISKYSLIKSVRLA